MEEPGNIRRFAISDIHGCAKTFRRLLKIKIELSREDEIYLLGDYINRGPDSKGVLDIIISLQKKGYKITLLRGNHEQLFLDALKNPKKQSRFLRYGGHTTLSSFQVKRIEDIPAKYVKLIKKTGLFCDLDKFILVHAGFTFNDTELNFHNKDAMLWLRSFRPPANVLNGKTVIHGHTPESNKKILRQMTKENLSVINIDSGCVYHPRAGSRLCAFELDTGKFYWSKNVDHQTNK